MRPGRRRCPMIRPSASCRGRRRPRHERGRSQTRRRRSLARPLDLEDHRVALTPARADRSAAETAAPPAELQYQAAEDPCPGGPDRVTERHGTAIDVDPVLVDPE